MPKGVERELKFGLPSAEHLLALMGSCGVKQENHFFDTADFALNAAKHTCRLRIEAGTYILGIKAPSTGGEGFAVKRPEHEWKLRASEANGMLSGRLSPLDYLLRRRLNGEQRRVIQELVRLADGQRLLPCGCFTNDRTTVQTRLRAGGTWVNAKLEFDRSVFPDGSESCELEAELPEGVSMAQYEKALRVLLRAAKVRPVKNAPKAKRFFDALRAVHRRGKRKRRTKSGVGNGSARVRA